MTQDQGQAALPATPELRVIAGRYAILREIGRGGMGIVWLAEDRMIGRRVAIKELHLPDGVPPAERGVFEERVLREARTAGRLNDPAVVIVYDVLQEAGNTYIVMELIEAPTLSDIVRQSGALPPDAVAGLATQLLSALESAHAAGIVHRDVKPSNVMVLPNGRVKLTDFGIAQSLDDPRLTTSGMLIGSPTYMAPERIHGAEADAASDLWALGAVLFYAVEGYSPFERSSTVATMHAITTEVPFLTRCQGPLASVIMGLLISAPQGRLTTHQVRGLLAQLNPGPHTGPQTVMLGGRYPYNNATVVTTGPQPVRRRGARPWLVAALVVVLLAGLAGGWFGHRWLTAVEPEAADGGVMTYGDGGDVQKFEVSNGYCASGGLRRGVSYPSTSDCKEAHDIQVFAVGSVFDDAGNVTMAYPDARKLSDAARTWCSLEFASKRVNAADKNTGLKFVSLVPNKDFWDRNSRTPNERQIICVLSSRDGSQLTGSKVAGN